MQEYAFAMGIYLTIFRSGSVSSNYLTSRLLQNELEYTFLAGTFFLMMSFISGLIFMFLEILAIRSDYAGVSSRMIQSYRFSHIKKFN